MVVVVRIAGVLALVLSCLLFITSGIRLIGDDPQIARIHGMPSALARFKEASQGAAEPATVVPPVMVQAQALAAYLNRSTNPAPSPTLGSHASPRPATPLEGLRLHATSYYLSQPDKSMALLSDPRSGREGQRWVKTGGRLGSVVVQEVRPGAIVYRDGDQFREAAVEHGPGRPSLVRDVRDPKRDIAGLGKVATADVPPVETRTPPGPRAAGVAITDANVPRVASVGWTSKTRRSRWGGSFRLAPRSPSDVADPNNITTSDN